MILFAVWAGRLWLTPVGPLFLEVPWLSMVVVGVIVAFLIAALALPRPGTGTPPPREARRDESVGLAIGIFFWLALIFLMIAVIGGYWQRV